MTAAARLVDTIRLWRYNQITGYWRIERTCSRRTADDWLTIFRRDEPNAIFTLSENKPRT